MINKIIFFIFFILIVYNPIFSQTIQNNDEETRIDLDKRIIKALYLSGQPESHLSALPGKLQTTPSLDGLSEEERQLLAIKEFNYVLSSEKKVLPIRIASIERFIAKAYLELAIELKKQYDSSFYSKPELEIRAKEAFENSLKYYKKAFEDVDDKDKYFFAQQLVKAAITSGNLYLALELINKLDSQNIKPERLSDHELLKIKGDILFIMGREKDAALAYEEWIARDYVSKQLSTEMILSRLRYLKEKTGHPKNLLTNR